MRRNLASMGVRRGMRIAGLLRALAQTSTEGANATGSRRCLHLSRRCLPHDPNQAVLIRLVDLLEAAAARAGTARKVIRFDPSLEHGIDPAWPVNEGTKHCSAHAAAPERGID